ncbi:hypothetical protein EYZ11_007411 [Aspergillus tanneri]|uniref:Uncharacterized protein n=1 Tax=Aspergillus tanneri TaxID=1220188 RepID=A0A4S3JD08_9EURO|nr:hypothetical protein EYZ11_007411 [Aspergillus tanneri]
MAYHMGPIVVWLQKYYAPLAIIGALVPVIIAHSGWDYWQGGAVYAVFQVAVTIHTPHTSRNVPFVAVLAAVEDGHPGQTKVGPARAASIPARESVMDYQATI